MFYTNTGGIPSVEPRNICGHIRNSIIAESTAITNYSNNILQTDIPEAEGLFRHIVKDEIRHYNMFLKLLRKYDPEQAYAFKNLSEEKYEQSSNLHFPKTINNKEIFNFIRSDIIGENQAIILYEDIMSNSRQPDVKRVFDEIIADEKHHFEELNLLLHSYGTQF